MSTKDQDKHEKSLLSTSSILILSSFLIGLTVGKIVAEDLSPYVLACGLSGFLAFIALDIAKMRRIENLTFAEQMQMEERLDKHVNSLSSIGFTLPQAEESFDDESEVSPAEVAAVS